MVLASLPVELRALEVAQVAGAIAGGGLNHSHVTPSVLRDVRDLLDHVELALLPRSDRT